jgi:hypothetical protein
MGSAERARRTVDGDGLLQNIQVMCSQPLFPCLSSTAVDMVVILRINSTFMEFTRIN